MSNSGPRRILILQLKRIGDTILTAPAVSALRAAHAEAELVAVTSATAAPLAECFVGLDRVLALYPGRLNVAVWASVLFGEWDLTLDFTGTDRSAAMAWLSRAKRTVGYAKFASRHWRARAYTELSQASVRDLHTRDFHLALTGCPAVSGTSLRVPSVLVPEAPSTYAVVHIGTAREEKFWPATRWAEVIQHLVRERQLPVVLTGTNEGLERPHLDLLREKLKVHVTDLTGRLSLVETAAVIARSQLALGVDSMAMHLAAMYERPQVVLFGPTNPHHWRPLHAKAITLLAGHPGPLASTRPRDQGGPLELISTQQVISAIDAAFT